jgi:hypothetical protein
MMQKLEKRENVSNEVCMGSHFLGNAKLTRLWLTHSSPRQSARSPSVYAPRRVLARFSLVLKRIVKLPVFLHFSGCKAKSSLASLFRAGIG